MSYNEKKIDEIVYSTELDAWVSEEEMKDYYNSYLEDQVDIHLNM